MAELSSHDGLARRPVLLVPGIDNSGPEHWQSRWEAQRDGYRRVPQRDWENPLCSEWMDSLELAVRRAGPRTVIAAHSLGCLLTVHWLARTRLQIGGALLVAIPDPDGLNFPSRASGFAPVPQQRLPCPGTVVASADDPYGDLEFARACAAAWGCRFVNIGRAGHINATSGLGDWNEGHRWLEALLNQPIESAGLPDAPA